MPHRSKRAVLLVTDHKTATTSETAKRLGAKPVMLQELTADDLADDPCMVFDVDLRKVDTVRTLKSALVIRGAGCRIFLVDPDNRVTAVHANVLGAHELLPRQASVADMQAAIDKHFNGHARTVGTAAAEASTTASKRSRESEAMLASIKVGVQALDSGFTSMINGDKLDTQGVIAACEQLADAVCVTSASNWMMAVRNHHEGTFQHCMLVTGVAAAFATETGMSRKDIVRVTVAGLLHDIGKAEVPTSVLDKPSGLTLREMDMIRRHPAAGHDYLVRNSTIEPAILSAVKHHHEYLDGSGYPDRLAAADIDAMTRIITVSDVYAALIERRSYKAPKSHAEAIAILLSMAAAGKIEARLVRDMDRIMAPGAR